MIGCRLSDLFVVEPELPVGFIYKSDFISREEEQLLVRAIQELEFTDVEMCDAADTATLTPGLSRMWRTNVKVQICAAAPLVRGIRPDTCASTNRVRLVW